LVFSQFKRDGKIELTHLDVAPFEILIAAI
jgi:hypothetical protein